MTHRILLAEALKALLPADLHRHAVVAGGYATDPAQARDIDLWLLNQSPDTEDIWSLVDDLSEHFKKHKIDAEFLEGAAVYPELPQRVASTKPILKMASLDLELPPQSPQFGWMNVQLIITSAKTVEELFDTFDLSVHKHAWALAEPQTMLTAADTTEPGDIFMRITRFDTPARTYQRALKLKDRYGCDTLWADVVQLLAASPALRQDVLGGMAYAA